LRAPPSPSDTVRIAPMRAMPVTSFATSSPASVVNFCSSKPLLSGTPISSAARTDSASSLSSATMVAVPVARASQPSPSAVGASP